MRLIVLECDWKDTFSAKEVQDAIKQVDDDDVQVCEIKQNLIDSRLLFICSGHVSIDKLRDLLECGDLWITDKMWEGTYEEIKEQIEEYVSNACWEEQSEM